MLRLCDICIAVCDGFDSAFWGGADSEHSVRGISFTPIPVFENF